MNPGARQCLRPGESIRYFHINLSNKINSIIQNYSSNNTIEYEELVTDLLNNDTIEI